MPKKDFDVATVKPVEINIPYDALKASLIEMLENKGAPIPPNLDEHIKRFAAKLVTSFADFESEDYIKLHIATGELKRPGDCVSDMIWENSYSLSQPSQDWFKKNKYKMYMQLKSFDNFGENIDVETKEFKKSFAQRIENEPVDSEITLQCYTAQKEFFPIEFVRDLGIDDITDLYPFSFSIVEIEKLMKDKKLHKYKEESPLGSAPSCVFFVRWMDGKIRMLSIRYSDTGKEWHYITRSIPYIADQGKYWGIPEKAKVFMKDAL